MYKQRSRKNTALCSIYVVIISFLAAGLFSCSLNTSGWKPAQSLLTTRWTGTVTPKNVLKEYPRPQMVRDDWYNLNGIWELALTAKDAEMPAAFSEKILVPFPIQSALSGIGKRVTDSTRIWYRKTFSIPSKWKNKRILLHFGAVDWETQVYINGKKAGEHRGGYDPFSFDITELCISGKKQELVVSVWDPTTRGGQPYGKQTLNPRGIYYSPSSGIWQTAWLEPVPETYIKDIKIVPDVDKRAVGITVELNNPSAGAVVNAEILENKKSIIKTSGKPGEQLSVTVPEAKLWSPDLPFLYDVEITVTDNSSKPKDKIRSYFGLRKIEVRPDEKGITRLFLNNTFVFQLGPLDQGFWPDGLYTAPTDEALKYDLEMMKKYGFNMVRKHVKVEPDRWYYWCDKLGLMVWQDMPNGRNRNDEERKQFETELTNVVVSLYNHPSIIMWVPFNEGWGQYDTERIVQRLKELDPTRLVNNASGWTDRGAGDVSDVHSYPNPRASQPEPNRAAVLGEFGGLGFNIPEHAWNPQGWGYDLLQNRNALIGKYENLYRQLLPLIDSPGLSAAVYTQITDIESENNGLMTYDREVAKIPPETAQIIHQGYFAPEKAGITNIFIDYTDISLFCRKEGAEIRYTLDGTEPTQMSLLYERPVRITESAVIKSKAFWKNGIVSRVDSFELKKTVPKPAETVVNPVKGLSAAYFEGNWRALPNFSDLTPVKMKTAQKFDLSPAERNNNFALRFKGYIRVPETGVYTFYTASDDGSRLFIGDTMLIDNDGVHGVQEKYGSIALEAGMHSIMVLYFQGTSGLGLQVSCEGPKIEKQEIPSNILYRIK